MGATRWVWAPVPQNRDGPLATPDLWPRHRLIGTELGRSGGAGLPTKRAGAEGTEIWLEEPNIAGVSGLQIAGDRLHATTMASESLVGIDLETATIESIINLRPFGGDGITPAGDGAFLVTDYRGMLLRVNQKDGREVLVDSRDAGISLTDHAFAPDLGLTLIPTLSGNSVIAFELDAETRLGEDAEKR